MEWLCLCLDTGGLASFATGRVAAYRCGWPESSGEGMVWEATSHLRPHGLKLSWSSSLSPVPNHSPHHTGDDWGGVS